MPKKKGLPALPTEDELTDIFLTTKGTVCRDCVLSDNCTYHQQDIQTFICPIDAHKLATRILDLLKSKGMTE